jgi:hypothetical protein
VPAVPDAIRFELDGRLVIPDWGVGGMSAAPDQVLIGVAPSLPEELLRVRLRGAVLHECFHVAQGFTADRFADRPVAPLVYAAYEGCASAFERDASGDDPPWARYEDEPTMLAWTAELAGTPASDDLSELLFFDPGTSRDYVIYRTGTFLVDRALARTGASFAELAGWTPEQVLDASGALPAP